MCGTVFVSPHSFITFLVKYILLQSTPSIKYRSCYMNAKILRTDDEGISLLNDSSLIPTFNLVMFYFFLMDYEF